MLQKSVVSAALRSFADVPVAILEAAGRRADDMTAAALRLVRFEVCRWPFLDAPAPGELRLVVAGRVNPAPNKETASRQISPNLVLISCRQFSGNLPRLCSSVRSQ